MARAAIDGEIGDDIASIFMSGTRATFTLKEGVKIDESALASAIEDKGLEFEGLTSRQSPRAQAAWVAKTPGLT